MIISTLLDLSMLRISMETSGSTLLWWLSLNYLLHLWDSFSWVWKVLNSLNNHYCFADRLGRRWVHVGCMVFSTLPIMICIFLVGTHDQAVVVLSIIFKLVSNVGWFIMWVQCFEVVVADVLSIKYLCLFISDYPN